LSATRFALAAGLQTFPREVFDLADTLEVLDLSGNALSVLPDDLPRLKRLRILFCSNNQFTELPEVLGQCPQLEMVGFKANRIERVPAAALPERLRWLILTDNAVAELPDAIGRCSRLQKLMLAGNRLQTLPHGLTQCTRLELLRIAANRLTALPDWLPTLPRLAWLAYAGNPLGHALEAIALADAPIAHIPWSQLHLQQVLGEGASGVIHRALWQRAGGLLPVAVKLFKGAVTSDGLPQSEMAACERAGDHPSLITVHGQIDGHPECANGLVLALVDGHYRNLAGPPSMASCTRDVYDSATRFTLPAALRIARGMASAGAQLHARGILHGDLYGHNILVGDGGDALLGDFGAASFFDPADTVRARALQRIEVRAFGCLLEELMACCDSAAADAPAIDALTQLQMRCLQADASQRPLFADIVPELLSL
jgi:hypothetical protein